MSWDSYLDNMIESSKDADCAAHIDKGCIFSLDGGSKWTTDGASLALKIDQQEVDKIAKCFKSKKFSDFQTGGIHIGGTKYNFIKHDVDGTVNVVHGKKKDHGSVTLQATSKAVTIAHCPEGSQQGQANAAVSKIAHYLDNSGF